MAEGHSAPKERPPSASYHGFWNDVWDFFFDDGGSPPPPPSPPPPLSVTITDPDGNKVDPKTVYYLDHGEEMYFDFTFTHFDTSTPITANLYESETVMYLHHYAHDGYGSNELNANYFAFTQDNDEKLGTFSKNYRVKVRRKDNWGYHSQGYVQLVIFFGRNTIVNGNRDGILFHEPGTAAAVRNNSVFVLHFNVFPKKPYPWES